MKRVLLLGGTGFVGRHVCEHLVRRGCDLTVLTRRAEHARLVQHLPGLTVLEGDAHDQATLRRLLPGHDAVVHLVAILQGREADFERVHVALPRKLAQACLTSGVWRLVHVSALGADPANATTAPSRYLRSKSRGEAVLREAAGATVGPSLQLTVLRPSVIFGADDRFLNLFAALQRVFPLLPLAGAEARFQPVWVEDVAEAVARCLLDARTVGQTYELCGPSVHSLRELVQLAGRAAGVPRPVIALPAMLGRLQAALMECAPGEPLMSRDNLDSMKVPNVATGRLPGLDALGITPASPMAVAPGYLGQTDPLLALRARWPGSGC
ncbi:complex I NDUFA9 subunit family protein [Hylemonella gracilis]|uniref:Complex I NDUFA9 subunit family protein n=1 Tax=Hylemonella gracilis TaxID=80880 RepID=A0A4P6UJT9_9BURK|nr:complex I NDUFA9 subunit family protein [Hylemonella gracilis]QBK04360.1 complex I NDUFA9 subunit family protein [Hylemonella gracilis]